MDVWAVAKGALGAVEVSCGLALMATGNSLIGAPLIGAGAGSFRSAVNDKNEDPRRAVTSLFWRNVVGGTSAAWYTALAAAAAPAGVLCTTLKARALFVVGKSVVFGVAKTGFHCAEEGEPPGSVLEAVGAVAVGAISSGIGDVTPGMMRIIVPESVQNQVVDLLTGHEHISHSLQKVASAASSSVVADLGHAITGEKEGTLGDAASHCVMKCVTAGVITAPQGGCEENSGALSLCSLSEKGAIKSSSATTKKQSERFPHLVGSSKHGKAD